MLLTDNDTDFRCSGASEKRSGPLINPKIGRIRRLATRITNNALPAAAEILDDNRPSGIEFKKFMHGHHKLPATSHGSTHEPREGRAELEDILEFKFLREGDDLVVCCQTGVVCGSICVWSQCRFRAKSMIFDLSSESYP
ncbi:MAG: hypothetical protein OXF88_19815 [Rhodobacteraceae bacterium]|nr:hypothetical protein [Paracoccaceae bacterium]